jgi:twitching motility two-component system response regulator PilH
MNNTSNTSALVVDDSFLNRQLLKTILEEEFSIAVKEAGDGQEALNVLSTYTPDIVILDLMMPIMDGIETLHQIRNKGLSFPVIILTADIQDATRAKCLQLGVAGFINKPSSENDIINLIREVLTKIGK